MNALLCLKHRRAANLRSYLNCCVSRDKKLTTLQRQLPRIPTIPPLIQTNFFTDEFLKYDMAERHGRHLERHTSRSLPYYKKIKKNCRVLSSTLELLGQRGVYGKHINPLNTPARACCQMSLQCAFPVTIHQ